MDILDFTFFATFRMDDDNTLHFNILENLGVLLPFGTEIAVIEKELTALTKSAMECS